MVVVVVAALLFPFFSILVFGECVHKYANSKINNKEKKHGKCVFALQEPPLMQPLL